MAKQMTRLKTYTVSTAVILVIAAFVLAPLFWALNNQTVRLTSQTYDSQSLKRL